MSARGGIIGYYPSDEPGFADGGAPGLSWMQSEKLAAHMPHPTTGFIHSAVPGRTDLIHAQPPSGGFVVPADVVSGTGEGNSTAGAAILQKAFSVGPFGVPLPPGRHGAGVGMPKPPAPFSGSYMAPAAKRGGKAKGDDTGSPTPILAAGGEYIIPPEVVAAWGGGDLKKGHDLLDAWVMDTRKKIAKEMLALPAPKK